MNTVLIDCYTHYKRVLTDKIKAAERKPDNTNKVSGLARLKQSLNYINNLLAAEESKLAGHMPSFRVYVGRDRVYESGATSFDAAFAEVARKYGIRDGEYVRVERL